MKKFRIIILSFLALHLLAVNTNLLINLTTYFKSEQKVFQIALAIFFSISYSLGTIYTLNRRGFVWLKVLFALLDGAAILLWYNSAIKGQDYVLFTSSFYAVYTIMIALGVGIRDKVRKSDTEVQKSKFLPLFIYGYLMYSKSKFRKSKDEQLLSIADAFELLSSKFKLDFDDDTVSNFKELESFINKL
jgi:hypothetical protein